MVKKCQNHHINHYYELCNGAQEYYSLCTREYHMWEGLIALQKIISESLDQLSMKN